MPVNENTPWRRCRTGSSVCRYCENRTSECHATCEVYRKEWEARQAELKDIHAEKQIRKDMDEYVLQRVWTLEKRRGLRRKK